MDVVIEYNDTYHPPQTEQHRRVVLTAGRKEGGREGGRGRGREMGGGEEREGGRAGRTVRELQIEKGVT